MCKHCHGCFDPLTNSVIPGAHPHAGRHKTRDCSWLNQHQHHGIVGGGGGGGHNILLHGCDFCHVQGWAPGVLIHSTHNCIDPRNPASRNPARGGGAMVVASKVVFCTFCNSTSHKEKHCRNPLNLAARGGSAPVARGGSAPVARGGGGVPAATPAYGTITNGQFWNGKGWRQILSIDHRPGGTLVTYRRQDGVSRQVQI